MVRNVIWEIVIKRASLTTTHAPHLTTLITGCKTKLVMKFNVGFRPKFLDYTYGNAIGKGLIEDLLNHTTVYEPYERPIICFGLVSRSSVALDCSFTID